MARLNPPRDPDPPQDYSALNLSAALDLAAAGIPVFPAALIWSETKGKFDKKPLILGWQEAATTDAAVILEWWITHPHAVPGIELGRAGLIAIDLDRHRGGPDGVAAFKKVANGRDLPASPVTLTASDGYHIYLMQPEGLPLGNRKGNLPAGIDIRGKGGWIVGPGAIAPQGQWRGANGKPALAEAFQTKTIPPIPDWITAAITAAKTNGSAPPPGNGTAGKRELAYAEAALRNAAERLAAAASGDRNEALNKTAFCLGKMVARGWLGHGAVEGRLLDAMSANGYIGEDGKASAIATLKSGIAAGLREPHADLTDAGPREKIAAHSKPEPPRPLIRELPPADPFPVEALRDVLGPAAAGIHERVQSPLALCGQSVLATATLAAQGHANIKLRSGQVRPLSGFFISVAASGERKSATDDEALWPVTKREKALEEQYAIDYPRFEDEKTAWDKAKEHVIKKAKGDRAEIRSALHNLGPAPVAPLMAVLTCPEPTWEGMCKYLVLGQPSMGIFSDEGGMFVGGHAMNQEAKLRTAAGLSGVWGGKSIKRMRAVDGTTVLPGRRISLHLMMQPDVATRMLSDPELVDQGLLSRCLTTAPETASGTRLDREPSEASDAAIKRYGAVILRMLERPLPLVEGKSNELAPREMVLSADAAKMMKDFANSIEVQMKPDGALSAILGLANKLPEHAARLAAVLTLVENLDAGEISADCMADGIILAEHYAAEALRLFEASRISADLRLAQKLLNWLLSGWEKPVVTPRDIYQFGPNAIREKATALKLVAILRDHDWLVPIEGGTEVDGHFRRDAFHIVRG